VGGSTTKVGALGLWEPGPPGDPLDVNPALWPTCTRQQVSAYLLANHRLSAPLLLAEEASVAGRSRGDAGRQRSRDPAANTQPGERPRESASHRLRLGRSGGVEELALVTKCLHPDRDLDLATPQVARPIVAALLKSRELGRCYLLAWCLMPDHIHLLLAPACERVPGKGSRSTALSEVIGDWADAATHLVNQATGTKGSLWQDGFHDHRVRRHERISDIVDYVHQNPVEAGLVSEPEQWPWSSAAEEFAAATDWDWYVGNRAQV
jgi:putative transposase